MLRIRQIEIDTDYPTMQVMWESNGYPCPPKGIFSPSGKGAPPFGIMIEYEEQPVCFVFMYHTGVDICMMEWMCSDTKAPKELRSRALDLMIDTAVAWAQKNNYEHIYTATDKQKFMRRLEEKNFVTDGPSKKHYFWNNEKTTNMEKQE